MVSWRWSTANIPAATRSAPAVLGFCPLCYAVVPVVLLVEHRRGAHPDTITEVP